MNIDLLFTQQGEAGLITSDILAKKVAGILFDPQNGIFTLEFSDMDYMDMNIPVDPEFHYYLDMNTRVHFGSLKNGQIDQAYQVPLLFNDDPYRAEINMPEKSENPLMAFQYFIQHCIAGQPVFRTDLGNEENMGCILGDSSPDQLQFAPHLARAHAIEMRQHAAPTLNAPGMGLGLGAGSGMTSTTGSGYYSGNAQQKRGGRGNDNGSNDGGGS